MSTTSSPDNRSACPGSPRPYFVTVGTWIFKGIYCIIILPLPAAFFLVLLIVCFVVVVPVFVLIALAMFIANVVRFVLGTFVAEYSYPDLADKPDSIRLLKILPGVFSDPLQCRLIDGEWSVCEYEALSYTWGCEWGGPGLVLLEGKQLRISATLQRALVSLRSETDTRTLWIDAICINQEKTEEKSAQVQHMQKIYQHAQKVIVWLDVDSWARPESGAIDDAFETAERWLASESSGSEFPGLWIETFNSIFQLPYWDRMWIIQEVASNRNVVVQCRLRTLPWDSVCQLITLSTTSRVFDLPDGLQDFVHRVEEIRSNESPDPPYGLLTFIHDFRYSIASEAKDRLYALRGLTKDPQSSPNVIVDYSKTAQEIWGDFTKNCLAKYNSLNALSIVDTHDHIQWDAVNTSWIPDVFGGLRISTKRLKANDIRQPFWFGTSDAETLYSAAGGSRARCATDLADSDIIGVQGFVYDTIDCVGEIFQTSHTPQRQRQILIKWRSTVEEQAKPCTDSEMNSILHDLLTAGKVSLDTNIDQLFESSLVDVKIDKQQWTERSSTITAACNRRRLITTKRHGKIGLAHSQSKSGDLICILLGSDVPYVLRRMRHDSVGFTHPARCWVTGCKRTAHLSCCIPDHHVIIGQAYVKDIMQYQGDIDQDIEAGRITLREFFLE